MLKKEETISDTKPDSTWSNISEKSSLFVPEVLYENRYCNQNDFSIVICGGKNKRFKIVNDVYELKRSNFNSCKLPSMLEARRECKTAVINSDIFAVGGYSDCYKDLFTIEKFSKSKNTWCSLGKLCDKRIEFCICSFKQNLYIIGGKDLHNFHIA